MASIAVVGKIEVRLKRETTAEHVHMFKDWAAGFETGVDPICEKGAIILTVAVNREAGWLKQLRSHPDVASAERYQENLPSFPSQ